MDFLGLWINSSKNFTCYNETNNLINMEVIYMTKLEKDTLKLVKLMRQRKELDAKIEMYKSIVAKEVREQKEAIEEALAEK